MSIKFVYFCALLFCVSELFMGRTFADEASPPPLSNHPVTISVTHNGFWPSAIQIYAGSEVTFENEDAWDAEVLLRQGAGTAIIRLTIDSGGNVDDAQVVQSSGWAQVDQNILRMAKSKTFPVSASAKRSFLVNYSFGSQTEPSDSLPFQQVTIKPGGDFKYTFSNPGSFHYFLSSDATVAETVYVIAHP